MWDGQVLLTYDPASAPAYRRIENPEVGQKPTFVLVEGSDDFVRACPDARRGRRRARVADYPAPLVIVAGDPAGIRKMVNRLAPLTQGGVAPRVIGLLIVTPSPDWEGSLLDPKDAASSADKASKAAGTFPVPVAIDIKGAAAHRITQAAGVDAGQTSPASIGFVRSYRTLAGSPNTGRSRCHPYLAGSQAGHARPQPM